jgi:serine/threonine-protein kinase
VAVTERRSRPGQHLLVPGTVFHDAYEVVGCIKAGGMGAVYEVLHTATMRRRALKVMLPNVVKDPDMRQRFRREATVAANVKSDSIVETLDAGVDEATGIPFILLELLEGEDLQTMVTERGPLGPEEACRLLAQAAVALDKTHAAGIIHRDLKPENLFLTRAEDGSPRLKILDFGVAKILEEQTAGIDTTRSVGSPLYMPPEQVLPGRGPLGPASDLYALGHVAFTLLTGTAYWAAERRTADGLVSFVLCVAMGAREPATARAARYGATLPVALDPWFARATAVDPAERFGGAGEMVAALAEALGVALGAGAAAAPLATVSSPSLPLGEVPRARASGSGEATPEPRVLPDGARDASGARFLETAGSGLSGALGGELERGGISRRSSAIAVAATAVVVLVLGGVLLLARGGAPAGGPPSHAVAPARSAPRAAGAPAAAAVDERAPAENAERAAHAATASASSGEARRSPPAAPTPRATAGAGPAPKPPRSSSAGKPAPASQPSPDNPLDRY